MANQPAPQDHIPAQQQQQQDQTRQQGQGTPAPAQPIYRDYASI